MAEIIEEKGELTLIQFFAGILVGGILGFCTCTIVSINNSDKDKNIPMPDNDGKGKSGDC
jgi:hypothetical protein